MRKHEILRQTKSLTGVTMTTIEKVINSFWDTVNTNIECNDKVAMPIGNIVKRTKHITANSVLNGKPLKARTINYLAFAPNKSFKRIILSIHVPEER